MTLMDANGRYIEKFRTLIENIQDANNVSGHRLHELDPCLQFVACLFGPFHAALLVALDSCKSIARISLLNL